MIINRDTKIPEDKKQYIFLICFDCKYMLRDSYFNNWICSMSRYKWGALQKGKRNCSYYSPI